MNIDIKITMAGQFIYKSCHNKFLSNSSVVLVYIDMDNKFISFRKTFVKMSINRTHGITIIDF